MRVWTTVIGQRLDAAENTRSMLLCAELLGRGYDVVLWTSAYDHIRKKWRREWIDSKGRPIRRGDDLEIRFMRGCGYTQNMGFRRMLDHWLAARDFLLQAPNMAQPDAIVASLPDHFTAEAAVAYGREKCIPTIVDVRDKWPDVFTDSLDNRFLVSAARLALFRESMRAAKALRDADAVVAAMQSMMTWGLAKAGRTPTWRERIFYLTTATKNFDVQPPEVPADSKVHSITQAVRGKVVFTFVGSFNRTQNPLLLLDAVDRLRARGVSLASHLAFIIGGDGVNAEEVRRRSARHDNVHCAGWLTNKEMSFILSRSHVGVLVMNYPSPAFNNKSFAYLASGLPIINGATGDLSDLIREERAGINVRGGDADALANAILILGNDDQLRVEMTANVRRLFAKRFDRETNYREYADHIERVANEVRSSRA